MTSRFLKMSRARTAALAVGVGVLSSLAFAGPSMAAAPNAGTACQAADGKINGRGATFATRAMTALIDGYRIDVCGPVASDPDAGVNMLAYNYAAAVANAGTGSGQGQRAASCRSDAFSLSDIPYDQATLANLNGAPGGLGGCPSTWAGPFQPTPSPFPSVNDTQAPMMSFPVAGSSDAIIVNLAPGAANNCPNRTSQTQPINLSTQAVSRLFGGDIQQWSDPLLTANNPGLVGCNVPVTRVVRLDKSGTTQIFKNYLKNSDGARSGATCEAATSWTTLALDANNQTWPTTAGAPGPCSALQRAATNGNGPMIALARTINGSISYPDLADAVVAGTPALTLASVRNATNTSFQAPGSGLAANCGFSVSLPGSSNADSVGLAAGANPDNWAIDSPANHSDVTFVGSKYPICGLTFAFVYTQLNNNAGANNPITRLTANQRRSLYSFWTYALSPAGQSRLNTIRYSSLPAAWLTKLRLGFQGGF